ncbi:MAG TPA: TolC family protein, partial [Burkholderiales bacterium]|nr:TolC family protein [Burkholderiales bacterium]
SAQWVQNALNWWKDPFSTEEKTSPAPEQRWRATQPLPTVPAPKDAALPLTTAAPLTLPELTELALVSNSRTRQAWLAARAAAAAVGIANADSLPNISGSWSATHTRPVSGTTGLIAPWLDRWGPSISFSYVLYDFGLVAARQQAAEYRLLATNLAQNRVLQEVVFQVEQAYYQLIGIEALVRVNEQALKNLETALDAARRRRDSGVATVADVYRSETQVAQARLTLTRSRGEFEKARGQLASVVGLPINISLRVQTLSAPPQAEQAVRSINDYLETVKSVRPDLVAAQAQVDSFRASAVAASKAGLPSIEFAANAQHSQWAAHGIQGANAASTVLEPFRPNTQTYAAGINLRIPIFSGFKDTYTQRQAEVQIQQAESTRDALYRQTQLEVWQAYYDLQTVIGSVSSTEALVKSAEQTAQATLARYQGGFGTILDLITAQQDETSARTQRIQSYLDWYTVLARLNLSVGAGDLMTTKTETKQ